VYCTIYSEINWCKLFFFDILIFMKCVWGLRADINSSETVCLSVVCLLSVCLSVRLSVCLIFQLSFKCGFKQRYFFLQSVGSVFRNRVFSAYMFYSFISTHLYAAPIRTDKKFSHIQAIQIFCKLNSAYYINVEY
jgi:hypothetical protein